MAKRVFDIFLALIGLFFLFPLWLLIACAIFAQAGRPMFYIQERVGKEGKIFKAVKFRTMGYRNQNSLLVRFLRRTALDELPQLINILKGEMSFVGPRPLITQEVEAEVLVSGRFSVRPGLTGVAQIKVFKDASLTEKTKYDIWYIEHQSMALDILLLLKSVSFSLKRRWDSITCSA